MRGSRYHWLPTSSSSPLPDTSTRVLSLKAATAMLRLLAVCILFYARLPLRLRSGGQCRRPDLVGHSGGLWLSTTSIPPSSSSPYPSLPSGITPAARYPAKQLSHSFSLPVSFSFSHSLALPQAWDSNHDSCPRPRHLAREGVAGFMPEVWNKSCCKQTALRTLLLVFLFWSNQIFRHTRYSASFCEEMILKKRQKDGSFRNAERFYF